VHRRKNGKGVIEFCGNRDHPCFEDEGSTPHYVHEALYSSPFASTFMAAIDGPMFDYCCPDTCGNNYDRYHCGKLLFLHLDTTRPGAEINIPSTRPNEGMTISVANGVASAEAGSVVAEGATVAVQLFPELVRESRNAATGPHSQVPLNTEVAAVGTLSDGRVFFAYHPHVSNMRHFAEILLEANVGVAEAGYTDGGGSARLEVKGVMVAGPNRRVLSFLVAVA